MILTNCTYCAAPLAHDAPHRCLRCQVRYCSPRCKKIYARALYKNPGATLDDVREAVATLEDIERIARRVFGSAHPTTTLIDKSLRHSRAALRARETPPPGSA